MPLTVIIKPGTPEFYGDPEFNAKPSGIIYVDGKEKATTRCCPHCNAHFVSQRGSGATRTFCRECMAVCCGRPQCMTHEQHFMRKIERMAKR